MSVFNNYFGDDVSKSEVQEVFEDSLPTTPPVDISTEQKENMGLSVSMSIDEDGNTFYSIDNLRSIDDVLCILKFFSMFRE